MTFWNEYFDDISEDLGQRNIQCVMWGPSSSAASSGVWMLTGDMTGKRIHRSIDGAVTFEEISLASNGADGNALSIDAGRDIQSIASDGLGNWMFGQESRLYSSTNDGKDWTKSTPWGSGGTPGQIRGFQYTNSSWVVIYSRSNAIYARSCAEDDITDWGTEFQPSVTYQKSGNDVTRNPLNPDNTIEKRASCASAEGRVVFATTNDKGIYHFDVNGKTITTGSAAGGVYFDSDGDYQGVSGWTDANTFQDLATDGTTWVATTKNGDVYKSIDRGETWTHVVDGFSDSNVANTDDWYAVTCDVTLPL